MSQTIAAIATPFGTGGISVIRVSGKDAVAAINAIFLGKDLLTQKSHTLHFGQLIDENHEVIDQVVVALYLSPRSFTGEDVVEISTHGGILVTQKVLNQILKNKQIRLANPGEFSERAFLNGKIDLIEAESIMDLIAAENENALKIASYGLTKEISKRIETLKDDVVNLISKLEVNIDYPEYDDAVVMTLDLILPEVEKLIQKVNDALIHSQKTRLIKDGIKTAIIGRPNVGKSSLLNALLNEEKAIVTSHAGTTRDTIEGKVNIGGITLNLIDTAGIRKTSDAVETIGVKRALKTLDEAELVLLVLDQSQTLTKEDKTLIKLTEDKIRIIIGNKADLKSNLKLDEMILISSLEKKGLDLLESEIVKKLSLSEITSGDLNYLSNERQINLLTEALDALKDSKISILNQMPVDLIVIDLKEAYLKLSDILGNTVQDELIKTLFSKFCLGK